MGVLAGSGRYVDVLLVLIILPLSIRPVATTAVTTTRQIANETARIGTRQIAVAIAGQIAAYVAKAALVQRRASVWCRVAPVRDTAKIKPLPQDGETKPGAIPADSTKAELRAAFAAGVCVVRATETFVRGDETLVEADGSENEVHGLIWLCS